MVNTRDSLRQRPTDCRSDCGWPVSDKRPEAWPHRRLDHERETVAPSAGSTDLRGPDAWHRRHRLRTGDGAGVSNTGWAAGRGYQSLPEVSEQVSVQTVSLTGTPQSKQARRRVVSPPQRPRDIPAFISDTSNSETDRITSWFTPHVLCAQSCNCSIWRRSGEIRRCRTAARQTRSSQWKRHKIREEMSYTLSV